MTSFHTSDIHFTRGADSLGVTPSRQVDAFITLWRQLAREQGPEGVPRKQAFTMQRLKPFLPHYFLAEWTGDDLQNRLVGSALDDQMGQRLTGESFLASYEGTQREYFKAFWAQLVDMPCGVTTRRTVHMGDDTTLRLSGVSLPLADQTGQVRYLCGVGDVARDFHHGAPAMSGRQVYIDHVQYLDVGFGLPDEVPDPSAFNAATDHAVAAARKGPLPG